MNKTPEILHFVQDDKVNFMKKFWKFLRLIRDTINGDFAYKNYLKHCGKNHPLSKKDFLRKREKTKWERINRCC